jgi:hypothetical protein
MEVYRQMALDAYKGEQRLNHTEVNREHVWRLLQGGELIAPVPPLPPREVPDVAESSSSVKSAQPGEQLGNGAVAPAPLDEAPLPTPPVKKTRTRKKAVTIPAEPTDPGPVIQVETGESPAIIPAKRGRKKKTGGDEALAGKRAGG